MPEVYDVFLSHSRSDAEWVESLAERLTDERGFNVWLDRWRLTPGGNWQPELTAGLRKAKSCAVCLGAAEPVRWFAEEIQLALYMHTRDPSFRVIPVFLPSAPEDTENTMPEFLSSRTWADFRPQQNAEYAFHVLCRGIQGMPIGRWRRPSAEEVGTRQGALDKLRLLASVADEVPIHEQVLIKYQDQLVADLLGRRRM